LRARIANPRYRAKEENLHYLQKQDSYIIESSLDYHYDILLEFYTYIDEIPEEHKAKCQVETWIDGEYGSQNIFI
jgi:hypothetical protein